MANPSRRGRGAWRVLRRTLLVLLLLPVLALAALAAGLWATLPGREETLRLAGLSAPVEIGIDEAGVPRIRAANERDAAMAMGVLHARDRLFQMEMMRRGASGRLAEVAGPSALRLDRFTRTLGLERRAAADLAAQAPETRALLEAYAAGVNAWIARRGRFAAPEFLALGVPAPWRPQDSLLWGKVMGLWLSGNWRTELDRARLAAILPPERLAELWPEDETSGRPEPDAPARAAAIEAGQFASLERHLPRWPEDAPLPNSASNAWALAPARSATGGALLASDPHLAFGAPVLWYLARIELPGGRFLAGATSPGVPFVVIGRNERLAWGFTTTHSDTQDVFVERVLSPDAYEGPAGPLPFAIREERIAVRGAADETLRARETRHGPVVSDLDEAPPEGRALAVAMANLAPGDTAASGLHALNRATDLAAARVAAASITSPSQNLMVADAAGGIAMYLTGRTPLRRAGDGTLPAPGWDGSHDWEGWVPFDRLPHAENPPGGALVNANNRVQPQGSDVFLGRDWFGDWRFRRIGELLGARARHAPDDLRAVQADAVSLLARDLLPGLLALPRPGGAAGAARDLLVSWDGAMAVDRPQPLIFNAWWREAGRMALEAGGVPRGAWAPSPEFIRFVMGPGGAPWCGAAGCAALAGQALERAVASLQTRFGQDPAAWRWGAAHVARFEHPVLRFVPVIGDWLRIGSPTPGDGETVNRGGMSADFSHVHGPGLRIVMDLASPDGVAAAIGTGQSGNPLSRHWSDLHGAWAAARLRPLPASAEAVERLRLEP